MTAAAASYEDIDDALGSRAQRYFSEGYKRVERRLRNIEVIAPTATTPGRLQAEAEVSYPQDWSLKGTRSRRAHLSTVDALQLSVDLAQAYLRSAGLHADAVPELWLRSVSMRAGAAPLEELAQFAVSAQLDRNVGGSVLGSRLIGFSCSVGSIRTRLQVGVPAERAAVDTEHPSAGMSCIPDNQQAERSLGIRNVQVAADGSSARAFIELPDSAVERAATGFGDSYQPSLTPLDALLVLAQVAQVLVYEQDHLHRSRSNTLWMRSFAVTARCPVQPCPPGFLCAVNSTDSRVIAHGGGRWRVAQLSGDLLGLHAESSIAHLLPA